MTGQIGPAGRIRREVVVLVAVEESTRVAGRAGIGQRAAVGEVWSAIAVTHAISSVVAMAGARRMRRGVLNAAEKVHEFMGFGRVTGVAPARAVYPCVAGTTVIDIRERGAVVTVER